MPEANRWPACFVNLHALIDRRMRGNAIHMQQLKCAQPQSNQNLGIELCIRMLQQRPDPLDRARSASAERRAPAPSSDADPVRKEPSTFLPRSRSSEWPLPFSMAFRIANAASARWRNCAHAANQAECPDCSPRAAQKIRRGHALLAFELQFDDFEPRVLRARDQQALVRRDATGPGSRRSCISVQPPAC